VISGYLITKIIERELAGRRFSITVFYQRRIRRIFPALFTVFAVSILTAWYMFPPDQFKDFGKSLVASSVFSANIYFYRHGVDYFAAGSAFQPLLHVWTLRLKSSSTWSGQFC
jgi:peptidoglycan/LPS O-acetylase OafA/YrhL